MTVVEYCTEEVRRQGHDLSALEGIERVGWMLDAWSYAINNSWREPTISDALLLWQKIERFENYEVPRTAFVRVGNHHCPPPREVRGKLVDLFGQTGIFSPLDFYREFELIHPFVDGNGRTGKVLLNWLNGSLLDPIFPPQDFWGHQIQNP